jgi:hypothetical protein
VVRHTHRQPLLACAAFAVARCRHTQ